jgi:hypothetical protein
MFSLKEVFFQPLKCQPNINTLHVHRNATNGIEQIFLIGLDGVGFLVEYIRSTNAYKAHPLVLSDVQCKIQWKIITVTQAMVNLISLSLISADCRILCMEILPVSKYNTSPAIIYGYARTTGMLVSRRMHCLFVYTHVRRFF